MDLLWTVFEHTQQLKQLAQHRVLVVKMGQLALKYFRYSMLLIMNEMCFSESCIHI